MTDRQGIPMRQPLNQIQTKQSPVIHQHVVFWQLRISAQQGSALIISLMILLVMTIVGVATMNSSMLEEKMATNNNDMTITFQAAEAGIGTGITDAKPPDAEFFTTSKSAYMDTCNGTPTDGPIKVYNIGATGTTTIANTQLTTKNMVHHINSSMGIFSGYNVEFKADGRMTTTDAKAINVQGALKGPYPFNETDPCLNNAGGAAGS